MADNEIRLVSKAIRERDLKPILERGIRADWFANPEAKEVFSYVVEHYDKYGVVPVAATVKDVLPGVKVLNVEESYDYLVDQFVAWRRKGLTIELLQNAAEAVEEEDHEEALARLRVGLAGLEDVGSGSHDIDLTRTVDERIAEYVALRDLPDGMRGIPTGFPTIDRATLGLQPEQLVTIVAEPKAGKSTLALVIARNVWQRAKSPLLVSFEMANREQEARHDALASKVAHSRLLSGDINDHDVKMLHKYLGEMKGKHPFHLVADPAGAATVSGIAAKIETYQPDVVFIDGVYLMQDEVSREQGTPSSLTNITRNLKRLAQRAKIPVVISTQALTWKLGAKRNVTADSIGYSSSFFQDSDVIFGLQHVDPEEYPDERILKVIASRACPNIKTHLHWEWDTGRFEEMEDGGDD